VHCLKEYFQPVSAVAYINLDAFLQCYVNFMPCAVITDRCFSRVNVFFWLTLWFDMKNLSLLWLKGLLYCDYVWSNGAHLPCGGCFLSKIIYPVKVCRLLKTRLCAILSQKTQCNFAAYFFLFGRVQFVSPPSPRKVAARNRSAFSDQFFETRGVAYYIKLVRVFRLADYSVLCI